VEEGNFLEASGITCAIILKCALKFIVSVDLYESGYGSQRSLENALMSLRFTRKKVGKILTSLAQISLPKTTVLYAITDVGS